jgi:hypothetical protein
MTEETDEESEDVTIKDLKKEQEKRRKIQQLILTKTAETEERISKTSSSISEIISVTEKKLEQLKIYKEKLLKTRLRLANKGSLSLTILDQLDEEMSNIEKEITPLYTLIPRTEAQESVIKESVSVQPKEIGFRTKIRMMPVSEDSILKNYSFFNKLADKKQRRAYESLLILRSFKLRILEKINEGIHEISRITCELDTEDFRVQEHLNTLIDFCHVSIDRQHLSDDAKYFISLYQNFKREAEKEPIYAAFAIFPHIVLQKVKQGGRGVSAIEEYTGLGRQTIIGGAQLLEKEGFIRKSGVIYFGDTWKTDDLFKSIQNSYRKVGV